MANIIHVCESLDNDYGGPARSVVNLAKSQVEMGNSILLISTFNSELSNNDLIEKYDLPWRQARFFGPAKIKLSFELIKALLQAIRDSEDQRQKPIVHIHNLWNFVPLACFLVCLAKSVPFCVSLRGSIFDWSLRQRRVFKKISWWLFQRKMLRNAKMLHVTSDEEEQALLKVLPKPRCLIKVPNGIEMPDFSQNRSFNSLHNRKILFLSRVHPKKGLDKLLLALNSIKEINLTLDIVGPTDIKAYHSKCVEIASGLPSNIKVNWIGSVDNDKKWDCYREADVFCLPSETENFGIVICEALYSGTPVITTNNTPWEVINEEKLGFCIDLKVEEITISLEKLLNLDTEALVKISENSTDYIKRNFKWKSISEEIQRGYGLDC